MQSASRTLFCAFLALSIALGYTSAIGTNPPGLHGETASGKTIQFPEVTAGKATVLILGFSRQGGQQTGTWADALSRDFAGDSNFATYTIAVLDDAPSMFRGMIKAGIRNGTPVSKRDHMVFSVSGASEWKNFLGVSDTKVPYLVLLDTSGRARWMGHGYFDAGQYQALKAAAKDAEASRK